MRNSALLSNSESADNQRIKELNFLSDSIENIDVKNSISGIFTKEEHEILANYVKRLCTTKESEVLVLSSNGHYFYDAEEMKNIKIVTSFKELNKISDLKVFLQSVYSIIQPKTFFIGHFTDFNQTGKINDEADITQQLSLKTNEDIKNGIRSRFTLINRLYNILDARAFNSLSRRTVELYLRNSGFKVVDMTSIKMTTCFCAQRLPSSNK
jgi:hypothetical protein